jgi:hypothetical protein
MSEERFPYLKNFLKPTKEGSAISDKTFGTTVSALLAPNGLGVPEKKFPTEIVFITSSDKKFRFHCSSETKRDEVRRVLEVLHIQPAIDELLRRGLISIEGHSSEAPPVTCESACPWYELNPWSRDPALGAWCYYRMEGLVVGSAVCEEFDRGEVPIKATPKTARQASAPGECILTCFECPLHEHDTVNPSEGWEVSKTKQGPVWLRHSL